MSFDNLGDRMKDYENVPRISLTKKLPVIIRLDGKAFHSFTKGMKRPFDEVLIRAMQKTAAYLCENVMGCRVAYTQSDEISLLLVDYEKVESQPWFDNSLQKMVSVAASMATMAFNNAFFDSVTEWFAQVREDGTCLDGNGLVIVDALLETYTSRYRKAMFDARAFTLPKEEVCNYFIWRQQDATRNSIQMVAQSLFSHKQLHGKDCSVLQNMMFTEYGVNWNDYQTYQKRGTCIVKEQYDKDGAIRSRWVPDLEIPIFTQDRNYIDKYVFCVKGGDVNV